MTTREIDRLIKAGKPVTLHSDLYNETFTVTFATRRPRSRVFTTVDGRVFEGDELEIVPLGTHYHFGRINEALPGDDCEACR